MSAHQSSAVRLHIVTGKGGTGKTTVAASLALALAAEGRRVLLVEVEERQGIAQLFETEALPYEERRIASASGGGEVHALAIDAELAMLDYLDMFYKLGRAGRALKKLGAIDFATTVAPGIRDVLLTGKVCEAVRRKDKAGWPVYDAVVLDAPPTGRITRFLNVNDEVAGLARMGPIHNQAQAVMRVLKSPQTAIHLVTLLEEMPVQETMDGVAELRAAGLPVGAVIVNMVRPVLLGDADLAKAAADRSAVAVGKRRTAVAKALSQAGLGGARRGGVAERLVDPLLAQAHEHAQRVVLEREQRAEIAALGLPVRELDLLGDGVDLGGLYRLADSLRKQAVPGVMEAAARAKGRTAAAGGPEDDDIEDADDADDEDEDEDEDA
ncbi:ArsA-related P-loop ATPase [Actinacidiphila bryophytorum]|uniref:Arsenical pump-driving ATPase n=1 Tax=Actinacidiphila bryophytorum TaxID=1436133 RepID=A0A9W4H1P9_9ACTN|nr:ArsA-related P-loop ATPase [Actinacidiphila bryophytorum]MBM9435134.1 AAA family ATPase [Actinacidiphila bryophytorum]MBN6544888.1 AAA family ATPase [Actinacidiphila bryophytorum]CAG7643344.1 Arsenical pump-driving ATPase [Actinacidiphila bryophytorum]